MINDQGNPIKNEQIAETDIPTPATPIDEAPGVKVYDRPHRRPIPVWIWLLLLIVAVAFAWFAFQAMS